MVDYLAFSLKFLTILHPKKVLLNDVDRVFIFRYFLSDDTMMIFEPPQRNSGIIGGKFLLRGKHKNPDTDRFFCKEDFKINGKIRCCGRCFQITNASKTTGAGASTGMRSFTRANIRAIINKLENKFRRNAASLAKTFRMIDRNGFARCGKRKLPHFVTDTLLLSFFFG